MRAGLVAIYNSFLGALTLAIVCFSNEWLQMRVNTGLIFFVSWLLIAVIFLIFSRKQPGLLGNGVTIGSLVTCLVINLLVIGWQSLQIVPAALIREGLHQTNLPFGWINRALGAWLLLGLVGIIVSSRRIQNKG